MAKQATKKTAANNNATTQSYIFRLPQSRSYFTILAASFGLCVVLALLFVQNSSVISEFYNTTMNHVFSARKPDAPSSVEYSEKNSNENNKPNPTPAQTSQIAYDFPPQVKLYSGTVIDSSRSVVAQRRSWIVDIHSSNNLNQTITEIKNVFTSNGWVVESELIDEQSITYAVSKENLSVVVYVMSDQKQSLVKYTVSEINSN